jgi:hypothetical protein
MSAQELTGSRAINRSSLGIALPVFALALAIRIHGISQHFWMLGDQIRDWAIALRPFSELPLVGPPTHVGGYTIGPAFYWILWILRVTFGPWFDNLPHAGGIGQAALQSAACWSPSGGGPLRRGSPSPRSSSSQRPRST